MKRKLSLKSAKVTALGLSFALSSSTISGINLKPTLASTNLEVDIIDNLDENLDNSSILEEFSEYNLIDIDNQISIQNDKIVEAYAVKGPLPGVKQILIFLKLADGYEIVELGTDVAEGFTITYGTTGVEDTIVNTSDIVYDIEAGIFRDSRSGYEDPSMFVVMVALDVYGDKQFSETDKFKVTYEPDTSKSYFKILNTTTNQEEVLKLQDLEVNNNELAPKLKVSEYNSDKREIVLELNNLLNDTNNGGSFEIVSVTDGTSLGTVTGNNIIVDLNEQKVKITLSTEIIGKAKEDEQYRVVYTQPSNTSEGIKDNYGYYVQTGEVSGEFTIVADSTAPKLLNTSSIYADSGSGGTITIKADEELSSCTLTGSDASDAFKLVAQNNNVEITVTQVDVGGAGDSKADEIVLTLDKPITKLADNAIETEHYYAVTYTQPNDDAKQIKDLTGNALENVGVDSSVLVARPTVLKLGTLSLTGLTYDKDKQEFYISASNPLTGNRGLILVNRSTGVETAIPTSRIKLRVTSLNGVRFPAFIVISNVDQIVPDGEYEIKFDSTGVTNPMRQLFTGQVVQNQTLADTSGNGVGVLKIVSEQPQISNEESTKPYYDNNEKAIVLQTSEILQEVKSNNLKSLFEVVSEDGDTVNIQKVTMQTKYNLDITEIKIFFDEDLKNGNYKVTYKSDGVTTLVDNVGNPLKEETIVVEISNGSTSSGGTSSGGTSGGGTSSGGTSGGGTSSGGTSSGGTSSGGTSSGGTSSGGTSSGGTSGGGTSGGGTSGGGTSGGGTSSTVTTTQVEQNTSNETDQEGEVNEQNTSNETDQEGEVNELDKEEVKDEISQDEISDEIANLGKSDEEIIPITIETINLPSISEDKVVEFTDVPEQHWASSSVDKLAKAGIINGLEDGSFNLTGNTKRADMAIIITRLLGLEGETTSNFEDIDPNAYYANAVGLAKQYGIISGSENKFNPVDNISRQDAIVMVSKVLENLGIEIDKDTTVLDKFPDAESISPYAQEAVAMLVNEGIIQGSNGKINPKAAITRAEITIIVDKVYDILADTLEESQI